MRHNSYLSMGGNYFTRRAGFVLEDREFHDEAAARAYAVEVWGMDECEADTYLARLKRAFYASIRTCGGTASVRGV